MQPKSNTEPLIHASDCAVHNAPAYEPGKCDCRAPIVQLVCRPSYENRPADKVVELEESADREAV